jgi:hypothetical protein
MQRQLAIALASSLVLLAVPVHGGEHHIKAILSPNGESGVAGFVQLTQLPHGGANLHVIATGLHPGDVYASFYYESADCTEPADLLGTFDGTGEVHGKIDDDLDEVGSVSVRVGPGYGALLACAKTH